MYKINLTLTILNVMLRTLLSNISMTSVLIFGFAVSSFIIMSVWSLHSSFSSFMIKSGSEKSVLITSVYSNSIESSVLVDFEINDVINTLSSYEIKPLSLFKRYQMVVKARTNYCSYSQGISVYSLVPIKVNEHSTSEKLSVGSNLANNCKLKVGNTIFLNNNSLTVTDIKSDSGVSGSRIETSLETLSLLNGKTPAVNALELHFTSVNEAENSIEILSKELSDFSVLNEKDFYRRQADQIFYIISIIIVELGGLLVVGSLASMFFSMSAIIQIRRRQYGILAIIGYEIEVLNLALMLECGLLSLTGAIIGSIAFLGMFSGTTLSTIELSSSSTLYFQSETSIFSVFFLWSVFFILAFSSARLLGIQKILRNNLTNVLEQK